MDVNDLENTSETSKSNLCPDRNANSNCQQISSASGGAIPKRNTKNESNSEKPNCLKINNNCNFNRICCKMGLGNGNDTDLDIIKASKEVISPFNLKQISTETDIDPSFVKRYVNKCSQNELNNSITSVTKTNCDKCSVTKPNSLTFENGTSSETNHSSTSCLSDEPGPSNAVFHIPQDVYASSTNSSSASSNNSNISHISDVIDSESDDTSLSLTDEGCVYTYKGGATVDLPEGFFLENRPQENFQPVFDVPNREQWRESSPEMDYLEMDFDPGPSCEADSESSVDFDLDEQNAQLEEAASSDVVKSEQQPEVVAESDLHLPSTSTGIRRVNNNVANYYNFSDIPNNRTDTGGQSPEDDSENSLVVDQECPVNYCVEQDLMNSVFYPDRPVSPLMHWEEKDAQQKQFNLLHAGCVTNAVLNALLALTKIPQKIIPEWANQYLQITNDIESEDIDLVEYLILKSQVLPSHRDVITGLKTVSGGNVCTRFFATWPERDFSLSHWLKYWLERRVIPIITINQQVNTKDSIFPEWQHHMVFGVCSNGIYLADPINCVAEDVIRKKLTSDSVLLIKRSDILSRWKKENCQGMDLGPLYSITDKRWHKINTLGKLVHLLREVKNDIHEKSGFNTCCHIPIPTSVQAGITLVSCVDNPACDTLEFCPELPFKK